MFCALNYSPSPPPCAGGWPLGAPAGRATPPPRAAQMRCGTVSAPDVTESRAARSLIGVCVVLSRDQWAMSGQRGGGEV